MNVDKVRRMNGMTKVALIGACMSFASLLTPAALAQERVCYDFDADVGIHGQGLRVKSASETAMRAGPDRLRIVQAQGRAAEVVPYIGSLHAVNTAAFVVRMSVKSEAEKPLAELSFTFPGEKSPRRLRTEVVPDGQMREYRLDLPSERPSKGGNVGFSFRPCTGTPVPAAEIEIESIALPLTAEADLRRLAEVARCRLTAAKDLVAALPQEPALSNEVAALEAERRSAKTAEDWRTLDGRFRRLHPRLAQARRELERREERMVERREAENGGWRSGLDMTSFGRYGWLALPRHGLGYGATESSVFVPHFRFAEGDRPTFRCWIPASEPVGESAAEDVTWTTQTLRSKVKVGERICTRTFREGLTAPGALFETDAPEVALSLWKGGDRSPGVVMGEFDGAFKTFEGDAVREIPWNRLSANYIVLCERPGRPTFPVVVTLEHHPESVRLLSDSLRFRRTDGVGQIGAAFLGGIAPGVVPEQKRVRRLAAIMNAYPWMCREDFRFNADRSEVEIRNRYTYLDLPNDWGTEGLHVAPLPPLVAFAVDEEAYPARLPPQTIDVGYMSLYGRYLVVCGEEAAYSLPVPDLRFVQRLDVCGHEALRAAASKAVETFWMPTLRAFAYEDSGSHLCATANLLPAWCFVGPAARQVIETRGLCFFDYIERGVRALDAIDFSFRSHRTAERTEPFTGKSYLTYGWRKWTGGREHFGDVTNFRGFEMTPFSEWLAITGRWNEYRDRWPVLKRHFDVLPRRADWAVMGLDCMEDRAKHQIDMGPDSWMAVVAGHRMAKGFGDERFADFCQYLAAKGAVALVTSFARRNWCLAYDNTWDLEKQIPEGGWDDTDGVIGCPWQRTGISLNALGGCVWSEEEFRLYREYVPGFVRLFLDNLERHYPQWIDIAYRSPVTGGGENEPFVQAQVLQAYELVGRPTDELFGLLRRALGEDLPRPGHSYVSWGTVDTLRVAFAHLLATRDNPLALGEHGASRVEEGRYDPATGVSRLVFAAKAAFDLQLVTAVRPASVKVNGHEVADWFFDPARRSLRFVCEPKEGTAVVEVVQPRVHPVHALIAPATPRVDHAPAIAVTQGERRRRPGEAAVYAPEGKVREIKVGGANAAVIGARARRLYFHCSDRTPFDAVVRCPGHPPCPVRVLPRQDADGRWLFRYDNGVDRTEAGAVDEGQLSRKLIERIEWKAGRILAICVEE